MADPTIDDVNNVYIPLQKVAHELQRTRSGVKMTVDVFKAVGRAIHIPLNLHQTLTDQQKEWKSFQLAVAAKRNTLGNAPRLKASQDVLDDLFELINYARSEVAFFNPALAPVVNQVALTGCWAEVGFQLNKNVWNNVRQTRNVWRWNGHYEEAEN